MKSPKFSSKKLLKSPKYPKKKISKKSGNPDTRKKEILKGRNFRSALDFMLNCTKKFWKISFSEKRKN